MRNIKEPSILYLHKKDCRNNTKEKKLKKFIEALETYKIKKGLV